MNIGDRLRRARDRKNLKQTQVMKLTGINNKTLSGYEKGVSEPDAENIRKLAELYEVSIDWLLGMTNDKNKLTSNTVQNNEFIIRELANKYNIDLSTPGVAEKLDKIIQIVIDDFEDKRK